MSPPHADPAAELQRSAELLRLVFDHAGEGISVFDAQLRLVAWNQRFLDCTGVPAELASAGQPLRELLRAMALAGEFGPCDIEAEVASRLADLGNGQPSLTQRARPNGRVVELRRSPTPGGGFVMLYADVTEHRGAEAALADQQRLRGLLLQHTAQGFWFIDNALLTTDVNPAMCRMLGLPREKLLGRSIYEFVDAANAAVFREHVRLRALGIADGYEITLLGADGQAVHCYNNATPVFDAQGRKVGAVGLFSDITPLKRAERQLRESEQRFRSMADAAPALIWLSDARGKATWFNQRWLSYTGRSLEEELSCNWGRRMYVGDQELCQRAFAEATARGAPYEVEYRVPAADGQLHWIIDSGIPRFSADGAFEGYTVYGWDITARKNAEAALRGAKEEAERANRAKSEFLSRMSHELRTPLNAVLGFAQLLETDPQEPLSPRQLERVRELLRGGRHLLSLINEVLDLARIEAGTLRLDLGAVKLCEVVGDSLRLVQPMAAQRGITLQVQAPLQAAHRVQADRMRLDQVLLNLLSNAIKYNRENGHVTLRWQDETATRSVLIEVTDTGHGLQPAQQERLFQIFDRLDAEHSAVEGTGIGLALSKWLVDLMRGEIGVRSQPGVGSTFWVRLGWHADEAATSASPADTDTDTDAETAIDEAAPTLGDSGRRRVLYIEDNPVNQLLMEGMLAQRPGLELLIASLPEPGLEMARSLQPDLVLLDIQLPGIDGFEVLRRMRADAATQHIPVVAVSANAMQSDLEAAHAAGFAAYVTKPLDLQPLLRVVDQVLAR